MVSTVTIFLGTNDLIVTKINSDPNSVQFISEMSVQITSKEIDSSRNTKPELELKVMS